MNNKYDYTAAYVKAAENAAYYEAERKRLFPLAKGELTAVFSRSTGKGLAWDNSFTRGNRRYAVTYSHVTATGTVDWKAYALSIGGNFKDAEKFRRPDSEREKIEF